MKHSHIFATSLLLITAPFSALASGIVVNEVMFDPIDSDTGAEWIELYNAGDGEQDISGWEVYPDGTGYITIPQGFSIGAKKFMRIHLRSSANNSATDIYSAAGSSNMSNTSGSVAIFSAEPRGKDTLKGFVQWGRAGETWEPTATDAGLWVKGTFIDLASFTEGSSLALKADGIIASGKNAWIISNAPTPGAYNTHTESASVSNSPFPSPSDTPTTSAGSSPSSTPPLSPRSTPVKTIKAYAGEDISSMVGATIQFLGRAKGINDEPIETLARFFWNFGDGETQEGRSVTHTYRIPGTYLAGIYASTGEYTASDYIRIQIIPNKVAISSVIGGADGYMRLTNMADIEADISGWNIHDNNGHTFMIPPNTKMARHGDIALSNSITGLLKEFASLPISVFYPNGIAAFTYAEATSTVEAKKFELILAGASSFQQSALATDTGARGAAIQRLRVSPVTSPTPAPSSAGHPDGRGDYAAPIQAPLALPFGIAVGVSILGAGGFLISKRIL